MTTYELKQQNELLTKSIEQLLRDYYTATNLHPDVDIMKITKEGSGFCTYTVTVTATI